MLLEICIYEGQCLVCVYLCVCMCVCVCVCNFCSCGKNYRIGHALLLFILNHSVAMPRASPITVAAEPVVIPHILSGFVSLHVHLASVLLKT